MKFFISLFLIVSLYSQIIDKIVIVVNDIPITSYEINKTTKIVGDKQKAISFLIDKALLNSAIKEKGIYVDDFDIDNEMGIIAKRSGMSLFNFKNYLLQQGKLESLKQKIKLDLQKKKLIDSLNVRVTIDDIKNYYNSHKDKFVLPKKIDVTQYSSKNKNSLLKVIQNPLSNVSDVEVKSLSLEFNKTNPDLYAFIAQSKEATFTKIINLQNRYTTFYIEKKHSSITLPLKQVQNKIYGFLLQQKAQTTLKDFLIKYKAKANIYSK